MGEKTEKEDKKRKIEGNTVEPTTFILSAICTKISQLKSVQLYNTTKRVFVVVDFNLRLIR